MYLDDGSIYLGIIRQYRSNPNDQDQDFLLAKAQRVDSDKLQPLYPVTGQGVYLNTRNVKRIEYVRASNRRGCKGENRMFDVRFEINGKKVSARDLGKAWTAEAKKGVEAELKKRNKGKGSMPPLGPHALSEGPEHLLRDAFVFILRRIEDLKASFFKRRIYHDIEARRIQLDAATESLVRSMSLAQLQFLLDLRRKYPNHKRGKGSTDLTDEEFKEFLRIVFEQKDRKEMRN